MWAHHFGRGLVPTTANFGRSGARPSHPELLDWLATEFIRSGWSMKAMHRLMVTLDRLSAIVPGRRTKTDRGPRERAARLVAAEADGRRGASRQHPGRCREAEPDHRFGPPVPVSARDDGSVETADDAQGNRRSIYLMVRRSQHLTFLDLFDTPDDGGQLSGTRRLDGSAPGPGIAARPLRRAERRRAWPSVSASTLATIPRLVSLTRIGCSSPASPRPREIARIRRVSKCPDRTLRNRMGAPQRRSGMAWRNAPPGFRRRSSC